MKFKDGNMGIKLQMDDQEVLSLLSALFGERHVCKMKELDCQVYYCSVCART